jgi:hypothetical protein
MMIICLLICLYFENVSTLETANDVTKPKIMNIVSQSRNPNFNKPLRDMMIICLLICLYIPILRFQGQCIYIGY